MRRTIFPVITIEVIPGLGRVSAPLGILCCSDSQVQGRRVIRSYPVTL